MPCKILELKKDKTISSKTKESLKAANSLGMKIILISGRPIQKATGIEKLAQYLGIKKEEIIAIGDADNDKEMLEYAGLGVAMGNAADEIKMLADFITKSNEEDGVAYVIEKFILNDR